ncbi:signal recognition particle-docking protein FtsY [Bifidobacterium primatium]|uniref:Signal recognition particle receptor FtsY n=2 Tax=Bifidobacterium primatium TaxID=2045438 RepID=A0A2M9H6I8_9BIFI|nr:signal recognition particle-docking protein FtsY [Bifidobacterium primatium]
MTLLIIGIVAVVAIIAIVAVVANRKKQSGAAVPPPETESQQVDKGPDLFATVVEPALKKAEAEEAGKKAEEAEKAETEEQLAETGKPAGAKAEEPESEPAAEPESEEEPAAEPEPAEAEEKPAPAPKAEVVKPEPAASRLTRLKSRLANSANPFGKALFAILTKDNLSEADWEDVEDTLLLADVGADASEQLVEELRKDARVNDEKTPAAVRGMLRDRLLDLVGRDMDRSLNASRPRPADAGPSVIMMVGVNGTGKTTTAGKLARLFVAEDKKVVMGAADTFRAAAADQLETWGRRVNVPVVRSEKDGADPASVAFEAAKAAKEQNADVLIIDTAGRLQNKANLMDELGKIRRVTEKTLPVEEVLLVLDATTGQNGMAQAKVFAEAIGITGIVLTKLDGSAKGGIVISVQKELGVPVKLIGLGEGPDDLAPFDPEGFVDGILG